MNEKFNPFEEDYANENDVQFEDEQGEIVLDLPGVSQAIPDGTYTAYVDKVEQKMSESGKLYLETKFIITSSAQYAGRKITDRFFLTESALWRLHRFLFAIGLTGEQGGTYKLKISELLGSTAVLTVKAEEYDGRKVPNVVGYRKAKEVVKNEQ